MGPQFNVYSKLKKLEVVEVKLFENGTPEETNVASFYSNPEFPAHISGLDSNLFYRCTGKKMKFGAANYDEYSQFKNHLAIMTGYKSAEEIWKKSGPSFFSELVNFSDCEGTIGPIICRKLYNDFKDNYDIADNYFKNIENKDENHKFWIHYQNWCKALFVARHNGAILIT